jgi:hypothetical protein
MPPTILVALGVLIVATFAGALLAPPEVSAERQFLRSQWPNRAAPTAAPSGRSRAA